MDKQHHRLSPPSARAREALHSYSSHRSPIHATAMSPEVSIPYSKSAAVSIPNQSREPYAPPPLPPPRILHDIAAGRDPGYVYANSIVNGDSAMGPGFASPGSSLQEHWDMHKAENMDYELAEERQRYRSPSIQDFHAMGHIDEGYHSMSGSSLARRMAYRDSCGSGSSSSLAERLKGERHLERQNRKDSSQAYDQRLLDKIGSLNTTPRSATFGSLDASSPVSQSPFHRLGQPPTPLKSNPFMDGSFSIKSESPFVAGSPFSSLRNKGTQPAVISPSSILNGAGGKSFTDYRSSRSDSVSASPSVADSEHYYPRQAASRRTESSGSICVPVEDGAASGAKRDGNYDQSEGNFTNDPDFDSDFPTEETRRMRRLQLDDRTPPALDVQSPNSRLGTKRKALSPPHGSPREDKTPLQIGGGTASEVYQRRTSGHHLASRASPVNRHQQPHGSVSPASSAGLRNGSYASSTGLSAGGSSSITSISSYGRLSPGAISPLSEHYDNRETHYLLSPSSEQNLQSLAALSHQQLIDTKVSSAATARKMSADNMVRGNGQNAPRIQSHLHMCACCPKKPKKFETEEELRQHQNEKQYQCQWCNNRFKNKNEMERHQNSLHIRRNSWSCATLDRNYKAAFHPANAILPNTTVNNQTPPQPPNAESQTDVCGYCGLNFPNFPQQDWAERSNHLITVHKFGECNQSKKFFRADHFRQHLKHSHAGTSGKWTNMLEASCMREEPGQSMESQNAELLRQNEILRQQAQGGLAQEVKLPDHLIQEHIPGAPVVNMMGGGHVMIPGNYGMMGMGMPGGNVELQHTKIDEEIHEEM